MDKNYRERIIIAHIDLLEIILEYLKMQIRPKHHKKVVFHGGCLSCDVQDTYGTSKCPGCKYFEPNWSLPDLSKRNFEKERIKHWARKDYEKETDNNWV